MQISVRLSGDLARALGRPRAIAMVAEPATVADLVAALIAAYPQDEVALSRAVVMVGGRHVGPNHPLESNRDVALLTPIAGGCSLVLRTHFSSPFRGGIHDHQCFCTPNHQRRYSHQWPSRP